MKTTLSLTLLVAVILGAGWVWRLRSPHFDVVFDAPSIPIDNLNLPLPMLAAQLPKNPGARTFLMRYKVLPDPARPWETLPHSLEYDRAKKRLDWHRDNVWFDRYDGANDAIITKVAAVKGGVNKLRHAGCKRSTPQEKT